MKLFKFKYRPSGEPTEVTSADLWIVKWECIEIRHWVDGDPNPKAKNKEFVAFTTEKDAQAFAQSLQDADSLTRTEGRKIEIYKQEPSSNA